MTTTNSDIRQAHKLLDYVAEGRAVLDSEVELLRSFLPELPKQKTLAELVENVEGAQPWDVDSYWLDELHAQLKGLETTAKPAHPEFLETEADYQNAPEGTVIAKGNASPWVKLGSLWKSAIYSSGNHIDLADDPRRVLRWGWGE